MTVYTGEFTDSEYLLQHRNDKILFILDGFDEVDSEIHQDPGNLFSPFQWLLHQTNLLITTRSYARDHLDNDMKGINHKSISEIHLLGFSSENQKKYANKFFSKIAPHVSENFINVFLQNSGPFTELAKFPLNLQIMCSLWTFQASSRINPSQDMTLTEFYYHTIVSFATRFLDKEKKDIRTHNLSPRAILLSTPVKDIMFFMKKCAVNSGPQTNYCVNTMTDFKEKRGMKIEDTRFDNDVLPMNIITAEERHPFKVIYKFVHLSLQEFFQCWDEVDKLITGENTASFDSVIAALYKPHDPSDFYKSSAKLKNIFGILAIEAQISTLEKMIMVLFDKINDDTLSVAIECFSEIFKNEGSSEIIKNKIEKTREIISKKIDELIKSSSIQKDMKKEEYVHCLAAIKRSNFFIKKIIIDAKLLENIEDYLNFSSFESSVKAKNTIILIEELAYYEKKIISKLIQCLEKEEISEKAKETLIALSVNKNDLLEKFFEGTNNVKKIERIANILKSLRYVDKEVIDKLLQHLEKNHFPLNSVTALGIMGAIDKVNVTKKLLEKLKENINGCVEPIIIALNQLDYFTDRPEPDRDFVSAVDAVLEESKRNDGIAFEFFNGLSDLPIKYLEKLFKERLPNGIECLQSISAILLKSRTSDVIKSGITLISNIKNREVFTDLSELFNHGDSSVRIKLIQELSGFNEEYFKETLQLFNKIHTDADTNVQLKIVETIEILTKKYTPTYLQIKNNVIELLLKIFQNTSHTGVRDRIINFLNVSADNIKEFLDLEIVKNTSRENNVFEPLLRIFQSTHDSSAKEGIINFLNENIRADNIKEFLDIIKNNSIENNLTELLFKILRNTDDLTVRERIIDFLNKDIIKNISKENAKEFIDIIKNNYNQKYDTKIDSNFLTKTDEVLWKFLRLLKKDELSEILTTYSTEKIIHQLFSSITNNPTTVLFDSVDSNEYPEFLMTVFIGILKNKEIDQLLLKTIYNFASLPCKREIISLLINALIYMENSDDHKKISGILDQFYKNHKSEFKKLLVEGLKKIGNDQYTRTLGRVKEFFVDAWFGENLFEYLKKYYPDAMGAKEVSQTSSGASVTNPIFINKDQISSIFTLTFNKIKNHLSFSNENSMKKINSKAFLRSAATQEDETKTSQMSDKKIFRSKVELNITSKPLPNSRLASNLIRMNSSHQESSETSSPKATNNPICLQPLLTEGNIILLSYFLHWFSAMSGNAVNNLTKHDKHQLKNALKKLDYFERIFSAQKKSYASNYDFLEDKFLFIEKELQNLKFTINRLIKKEKACLSQLSEIQRKLKRIEGVIKKVSVNNQRLRHFISLEKRRIQHGQYTNQEVDVILRYNVIKNRLTQEIVQASSTLSPSIEAVLLEASGKTCNASLLFSQLQQFWQRPRISSSKKTYSEISQLKSQFKN